MLSNQKENLTSVLDQVSGMAELQAVPGFFEEAGRLRARLADDEFRIAVVGEFSSGKSTFINALLGRDILQHASTETTAAVTRIVNVPPQDPRLMTGLVSLKSGESVPLFNFKELREYTTTSSKRYQVVNDIASVELYLSFLPIARPVTLVDTPGLNGTAEGHREQTVELIEKAHACIYLIPRSGLGESDIFFLAYLARFQRNFIFVQNFIDELRAAEGDSVEKKLAEQNRILAEKVFAENPECVYTICGVSALMELASADSSIDRLYADSPHLLTPEDRVQLHAVSGFDHFRRVLQEMFQENRMDEIQYGGTARAIANWLEALLEQISRRQQQAMEYFNASLEKRSLEKLRRLKDKILEREPRQRENLQNFVTARSNEIFQAEKEKFRLNLEEQNHAADEQIDAIRQLADLEKLEKALPALLENQTGILLEDGYAHLAQKYQALYQVLLTKIDEYSGIQSGEELELQTLALTPPAEKQPAFEQADGRIKGWENEVREKEQQMRAMEEKAVQDSIDLREAQRSQTSAEQAKKALEDQKARDLSSMGARPKATERQESYIDYVYRGGFGILDKLFGPKAVTRYRTVRDDSAGQAWDQKCAKIEHAFLEKNDQLTKELGAAQRKKDRLLAQQATTQQRLAGLEERIRTLKQDIAIETQKVEKEKKQAAQEYLSLRKDSLKRQIRTYLLGDGGVLEYAEKAMASTVQTVEQSFEALAMERFTKALEQKLRWIAQMEQEESPEILQQANALSAVCKDLESLIAKVRCPSK